MADNNKNPNEKQPGENPDGKYHFNPGNMAGKKPKDPEQTAENRGEKPHAEEEKCTAPVLRAQIVRTKMPRLTVLLTACVFVAGPASAQNLSPNEYIQNEADKGIKTQNSGALGMEGSQEKPGSHAPGQPGIGAASATSSQNSGTGISGVPGGKSGPPPGQGTVGAAGSTSVQQQDPANIKGLPGSKSGPPAPR